MNPISILNNPPETVVPPTSVTPPVDSPNGHSPFDEQPSLNQDSNGDSVVASLPFFESQDELQEIAIGLAFAREEEQDIIEELKAVHSDRIQALKNQYTAQDEYQKTLIRITQERINQDTRKLNQCLSTTAALETQERSLKDQVQIISNDINLTLQELTQERLKHEKEFFKSEMDRLRSKQRQEEAVKDLEDEFELAEKVYDLKQRQWEKNQNEYKRIVDDAKAERLKVEDQLKQISERLHRFQQFGVSRTTAGFLLHAGYASFAAVGALIAGFFEKRQDPKGDFLSRIIDGFGSLIGLSQGGRALWGPLINLVLLMGFGIAVVTVTTFVMHWLIGKLDVNWNGGRTRKRRTEVTKRFVDRLTGWATNVTSWFGAEGAGNQDVPSSSRNRNRSTKDKNQPVDRRDFVQLLAQMPYIIGVAVLFFFLAALGLAKDSAGNSLPLLEISSTYIGVIFLTLSASAAILYVTNVIEPRWRRYESRAEEEKPFRKIVKLNWEFVVLVFALLVSLAMVAFLGTGDRSNRAALGAMAISMSLASLGLAYGLVQRGLFKDFDKAESRRQIYRQQIDTYSQFPKVDDVFENFDLREVGDSLRENRLTQHKIDELRMLSELNKIFADDFPDDSHLEGFLAQFVSTDINFKGMRNRQRVIDPLDGKFPVSPEKIQWIYSRKGERGLVGTKIGDVRSDLEKLYSERQTLDERLDKLRGVLMDQELELIKIQETFGERRQDLERNHRKEIMKLKSAYRIGRTAYELIRQEQSSNGVAA